MVLSDIVERIKGEDIEVPGAGAAGAQRQGKAGSKEGVKTEADERRVVRRERKSARPAAPAPVPGRVTR